MTSVRSKNIYKRLKLILFIVVFLFLINDCKQIHDNFVETTAENQDVLQRRRREAQRPLDFKEMKELLENELALIELANAAADAEEEVDNMLALENAERAAENLRMALNRAISALNRLIELQQEEQKKEQEEEQKKERKQAEKKEEQEKIEEEEEEEKEEKEAKLEYRKAQRKYKAAKINYETLQHRYQLSLRILLIKIMTARAANLRAALHRAELDALQAAIHAFQEEEAQAVIQDVQDAARESEITAQQDVNQAAQAAATAEEQAKQLEAAQNAMNDAYKALINSTISQETKAVKVAELQATTADTTTTTTTTAPAATTVVVEVNIEVENETNITLVEELNEAFQEQNNILLEVTRQLLEQLYPRAF